MHIEEDPAVEEFLAHFGVKGQKWGVRKDERPLGASDRALNISQRAQVKVASSISALAAIGMSTNAAATLFQLQNRWERLQAVNAILKEAENNPLIGEAGKEALRATKSNVIKGIVGSAVATTAISMAIGIVTQRTAKAYFAPLHKVYGDAKPKINRDIRKLSKEVKAGTRPKMTTSQYNAEVSKIVQTHMTADKSNILKPFHEIARSQLGLQYGTKPLEIKFEKLPNTELMDKMTIVTPDGLVLVKAVKVVEHADIYGDADDLNFYFDYKFDADGYISEWSSPTIEVAHDIFEGKLDVPALSTKYTHIDKEVMHMETKNDDLLGNFLAHVEEKEIAELTSGPTIKDIYDDMTTEQSDLSDLIVGAAVENMLLPDGSIRKNRIRHDDIDYDAVDGFLAHYGIKGQRWGIRRQDGSDGTVSGGMSKKERKEAIKELKKTGGGKNDDGMSEDAKRFVRTRQKSGAEMSDAEIKLAVERAKRINEYNKMFPQGDPILAARRADLENKEKIAEIEAKLNPSTTARVVSLITASAGPSWAAYQAIDNHMKDKDGNGGLTDVIKAAMKKTDSPSNPSPSPRMPLLTPTPKLPKYQPTHRRPDRINVNENAPRVGAGKRKRTENPIEAYKRSREEDGRSN